FRWLTLVAIIALGAAAAATRTARPPHAVALVDAAGLAALLLAVLLAVDALIAVFGDGNGGGFDAAWGWELVLLACGAALVAFAVRERERGPAYLGALVLLAFAAIAAPHDKASLIGWPIVLLIVAGALLAAALRPPPRPLPAEHEVTVRG